MAVSDLTNATQQGGGSTAKTQVGTSTIAKKMFGTTPIAKEVVNGVTVYEASAPSGYSITVTGDCDTGSDTGSAYMKINSAPTSNSDYDIKVTTLGVLYLRDGTPVQNDYVFNNVVKIYLFGDTTENGYTLNNGAYVGFLLAGYENAIEVVLSQNSTIKLWGVYD